MKTNKILCVFLFLSLGVGFAMNARSSGAERYVLSNDKVRAEFDGRDIVALSDIKTGDRVQWSGENFSLTIDGEKIEGAALGTPSVKKEKDSLTFNHTSGLYKIRVIYELKRGWHFISKQIYVEHPQSAGFHVNEVEAFAAKLVTPVLGELRLSEGRFGTLLRLAKTTDVQNQKAAFGIFILYQNPFMAWKAGHQGVSAAYLPDMDWRSEYGPFASDRLCIGLVEHSGAGYPAKSILEWKYVPDYEKFMAENPLIDRAEADALVECVRAFLLVRPKKSIRVHVPWCENDYQVDVATPEGWTEYKRIIDRAAELGCGHMLFTPANSELSSLKENADAWGWENLLWFAMGQKVRKGEWDPARDPVPASLQKMLDYGKSRNIKFMSYSYPSLAFKQNPEWTEWAGDKVGGYAGADTGLRSFQDWWIDKLVAFVNKTGAGGFSFDHWWIAYDKASSKYPQWYGCRRILESLRRQVPAIVIDGRQQYMNFGPWTWLAGSYPHPTLTDEQPESFVGFPDLHTDRVSADRQRFAAWKYRMERFCPPEIMPGYITHQTERSDAKQVMRRDRFRPRDWDLLGWRYSLLSSIATAPFNHVVDFIPARDEEEFRLLSEEDKKWFRGWLDWTDKNLEILRWVKPIIGQPMIGRVDGTAAVLDDRGFIFLFNPNYRRLDAEFKLDASIGLTRGQSFVVKELYPEAGKLIGKDGMGFWNFGDKVRLAMDGAQAVVLEVGPEPKSLAEPLLFGVPGKAAVRNGRLELSGVTGETGAEKEMLVLLPDGIQIKSFRVNDKDTLFRQNQNAVTAKVRFAGEQFRQCQPLWIHDPNFSGGAIKASFRIPARIFDQLSKRKESWPVSYTEDDLLATWLGSYRLLIYAQIAEPDETMAVMMKINGRPVEAKKAYNSIYGHSPKRTFMGFYADISNLKPDTEYSIEVALPKLAPGQFQGLFFENIEPEYTGEIR